MDSVDRSLLDVVYSWFRWQQEGVGRSHLHFPVLSGINLTQDAVNRLLFASAQFQNDTYLEYRNTTYVLAGLEQWESECETERATLFNEFASSSKQHFMEHANQLLTGDDLMLEDLFLTSCVKVLMRWSQSEMYVFLMLFNKKNWCWDMILLRGHPPFWAEQR